MNPATCDQALRTYESISMNYTLEGRKLHWIACALYVECRNSNPQFVGHTSYVEGNCVSLTRLLSTCDITLLDFFTKMKKWADMTNLNDLMRSRMEGIETSFCVTAQIYEKYTTIFSAVFKERNHDAPKQVATGYKKRTNKLPLCTSDDMFSFLWTLYVYIKGRFSRISSDLVNCYHLLLCCIDYGYSTAVSAKRTELLNSDFYATQLEKVGDNGNEDVGIIRELVESHDGSYEDASVLREHHFKHPIGKLMAENVLYGDKKTLTLSLEPSAFVDSVRKLNKTYEERFLKEGELDERIFFEDDAHKRIGTARRPLSLAHQKHTSAQGAAEKLMEASQPRTPLTGRWNLYNREAINRSPVSTATLCATKLQALLADCKNSPSKELLALFGEFEPTLRTSIADTVHKMGDVFVKAYDGSVSKQCEAASYTDFARKRLQLGETLFYKVLEEIIGVEKRQQRPNTDLSAHLCHDIFQQSLFACCMEIVMFCYNSQREFPWILEIFNLVPYNFYKIIEPFIRAEEGLWREVVKHLNQTEEQILECFAWREESPLWEAIKHSAQPVPTCEEVLLPRQMATSREGEPKTRTLSHLPVKTMKQTKDGTALPEPERNPFLTQRLLPSLSEARAGSNNSCKPSDTSAVEKTCKTPNTVLVSYSYIVGSTKNENKGILGEGKNGEGSQPPAMPVTEASLAEVITSCPEAVEDERPVRSGSLALFFRKVYHLSAVRLQDLCERLNILDVNVHHKIWTCFEHSIVHHTDLMRDRHLDQLILCAVYMVTKVTGAGKNFQEILHCYRQQPQTKSHVYRSVLLRKNGSDEDGQCGQQVCSSSTLVPLPPDGLPPTPTRLAGTATQFEMDQRGDIMKFYNEVYHKRMTQFASKFSPAEDGSVCLTPLPLFKPSLHSPRRRVSYHRDVFVSSLGAGCYHLSPDHHTYHVNCGNGFREINQMVQGGDNVRKRILQGDASDDEAPQAKRRFFDKIQAVIRERRDVGNGHSA